MEWGPLLQEVFGPLILFECKSLVSLWFLEHSLELAEDSSYPDVPILSSIMLLFSLCVLLRLGLFLK